MGQQVSKHEVEEKRWEGRGRKGMKEERKGVRLNENGRRFMAERERESKRLFNRNTRMK